MHISRLYRGQRMNVGTKGVEQKMENMVLPAPLSDVVPHFIEAMKLEGASIRDEVLLRVMNLEFGRLEQSVDMLSVHASVSFDGKRTGLTHQTLIRDGLGERVMGWRKSRVEYKGVSQALQDYHGNLDRAIVLVLRDKDVPGEKPMFFAALFTDRGSGVPSVELKAFGKHELLQNGNAVQKEPKHVGSAAQQASMQQ